MMLLKESSLSRRNLSRFVLAFSLLVVLFTVAYSWYSWREIKAREMHHLEVIAELGGKSVNAYFLSYQVGLQLLRDEIIAQGMPPDTGQLVVLLKRFHRAHPELGNVNFSLPDGQFIASAVDTGAPLPKTRQGSFMEAVAELHSGKEFTIGRPLFGKIIKKWVIPLRHAVRDSSGQLVYILSATLPLADQQSFWKDIFLPENAGMGLLRDDLYLQSRYPLLEGQSEESTYEKKRAGQATNYIKTHNFPRRGSGEGFNAASGQNNVFSVRRLDDFPMTLFVNLPTRWVVGSWLNQAKPFFVLVLIFYITVLYAAYLVQRRSATIETERATAANRIQQSEERFDLAMQGASDGLWDWNVASGEVYFSPRWKSMLGYQDHEIEPRMASLYSLIHPEDLDKVRDQIAACENGTANKFEVSMRMRSHKAGWRHVLSRAFVLRDAADNRLLRLVGTHVDMTEQYNAALRERQRNEVQSRVFKGDSIEQVLDAIVSLVESENREIKAAILLVDDDETRLRIGSAPSLPVEFRECLQGMAIRIGLNSCSAAASSGKLAIVDDIHNSPLWSSPYIESATQAGIRASWAAPILSAGGQVLGTVAFFRSETIQPNSGDLELLDLAVMLAATAIEEGHAQEAMQQASLVYQNIHEGMAVCDGKGVILSVNPAFTTLTGYAADELIGKTFRVLKSGHHDDAFYKEFYNSLHATNAWQGEFWNKRKNGDFFVSQCNISCRKTPDGRIHDYVCLYQDITEKKSSDELIWTQANFDNLTGLPNRRMFLDRLAGEIKKAERSGKPLALMFLDLDRFKEINDTLGHDAGDSLLKVAAERITSCVRATDIVSRLGGDEFTVILGEVEETGNVDRVAQSILGKLAAAFDLGNKTAYISGSIGVTLYPADATTLENLLRNADNAMYASKQAGRNRFSYFTPEMQAASRRRAQLSNDLRQAIDAGQFQVHYQPVVNLATGEVEKAEALLRWNHPVHGAVSPDEFIVCAEESGLISRIGDWVFREVTSQAARWRQTYASQIQVSINTSPIQFRSEIDAHAGWGEHMAQHGLPCREVALEITEGALLEATESITHQLNICREMGMQISLDDFGTGYSSLAYLKKFDIDFLKIDKAFVSHLTAGSDDLALCEAIIGMAHKLGIKVIAEGVETDEQRELLTAATCNYAQGYLFSPAIPAADFEARYLARNAMHF